MMEILGTLMGSEGYETAAIALPKSNKEKLQLKAAMQRAHFPTLWGKLKAP